MVGKEDGMNPIALYEGCQGAIMDGSQSVPLKYPGRWGKSDKRQFCKGGPWGQIVQETKDGLVVMFDAKELLDLAHKVLIDTCKELGCSGVDPATCPGNYQCSILRTLFLVRVK
jgi:hypothetical protein